MYALESELWKRDYRRNGGSSKIRDRYKNISIARGNMLRQRGYVDVQNYGNDDSVLMTKAQEKKMWSYKDPVARANYVGRVYEGLSNG